MAGCEGFESAVYLRSLFLSMATGMRVSEGSAGEKLDLHLLTDCRSLYDHIHREGVPRAPSEKRLAIDLAGLRQGLLIEAKHQWRHRFPGESRPTPQKPLKPPIHWLPTGEQLADILTKMRADEWWNKISSGRLALPFKESQTC